MHKKSKSQAQGRNVTNYNTTTGFRNAVTRNRNDVLSNDNAQQRGGLAQNAQKDVFSDNMNKPVGEI